MKAFINCLPDWMNLLYDQVFEEVYHELQEESEAFRYYVKLSNEIQQKENICSLLLEHGKIDTGCKLSKKQLQRVSDMIECENRKNNMILLRVYWKAWRDCRHCLKLAGTISEKRDHYEQIPFISRE